MYDGTNIITIFLVQYDDSNLDGLTDLNSNTILLLYLEIQIENYCLITKRNLFWFKGTKSEV